jgi:hypothetical protein
MKQLLMLLAILLVFPVAFAGNGGDNCRNINAKALFQGEEYGVEYNGIVYDICYVSKVWGNINGSWSDRRRADLSRRIICRAAGCGDRLLQTVAHVVVHIVNNRAVLVEYLLQAAAVVVGVLEGFSGRIDDREQERYEENRQRYFFQESHVLTLL